MQRIRKPRWPDKPNTRTPDELCRMLESLNKVGAEYVLLTISGGKEQLQRFALEIMPKFSSA